MKQGIQVFNHEMFGDIRTMTNEKGETFFVGKDVAKALGYNNTRDALRKHVDAEDKEDGVAFCDSIGRRQKGIIINESGLYALVLSSKLSRAKEFKRWVTSEVLPQIRRTGGYIPTHDGEGRRLTDEEIMKRGIAILGKTIGMHNATNEDCLTATEVAHLWGMDVISFNNLLQGMGILYRRDGRWNLTEELEGKGLAEVRCFGFLSLKGKLRMSRYLVWTPQGVNFLNMAVRKLPRTINANVQLRLEIED